MCFRFSPIHLSPCPELLCTQGPPCPEGTRLFPLHPSRGAASLRYAELLSVRRSAKYPFVSVSFRIRQDAHS